MVSAGDVFTSASKNRCSPVCAERPPARTDARFHRDVIVDPLRRAVVDRSRLVFRRGNPLTFSFFAVSGCLLFPRLSQRPITCVSTPWTTLFRLARRDSRGARARDDDDDDGLSAWLRGFRRSRTSTGARPGRPRGLIFNPAPPSPTISTSLPPSHPSVGPPLVVSLGRSFFPRTDDSAVPPPTRLNLCPRAANDLVSFLPYFSVNYSKAATKTQ